MGSVWSTNDCPEAGRPWSPEWQEGCGEAEDQETEMQKNKSTSSQRKGGMREGRRVGTKSWIQPKDNKVADFQSREMKSPQAWFILEKVSTFHARSGDMGDD
ncbi:hypothetical protein AMTR_s00050p00191240 [Amborella trichopoda]|uniref:Uncharacterized protein n=1 Tax=Amborella trichopoda TaxID=13333 RepID=W1PXE7_AMBTC|nr:hypothetical protein AMTR_s00050p00191240 [Amborella trichopoda]